MKPNQKITFLSVFLFLLGFLLFINYDRSLAASDALINLNVQVITETPTPSATPAPTSTPVPTNPPSGGGGGGGGIIQPIIGTSKVEFKGYAYPNVVVNVLKDGATAGRTIADENGNFSFALSDLSGGTYNFGFWADDRLGRRSIVFSFQITLVNGSTTKISGIVLPPTIVLDKDSVGPGGSIAVSGISAPLNQISVEVNSEPRQYIVSALNNGDYNRAFSTAGLEIGVHTAKSKTKILVTNDESVFSQLMVFGVGVKSPVPACSTNADINGNDKVNLVDFSVMAYWWRRSLPANSPVDLNCDRLLNLADFSILAFHWTG